ncbi:MAG: ABC transporter ATP-binding protein [Ruminococcaceae bacterium]|nr:ABC transporter ATP-binding protein [Oscillospiraceae bacterium]
MMGEVLADLCLPFLMSFIVDFGIEADGLQTITDSPLAYGIMSTLWGKDFTQMQIILTFGLLMLLITLVGGFFGVFCAYTAARAAQGFGNDLRRDAYARVMSLSIEQTDRFTTGSLVTRMTNDIAMIVEFIEQMLRMFVRAPMFLIGGTVMLILLDADFGLVLLFSVPVLLLTMILVLSRAIPMYAKLQRRLDRVNSVVQENVSGARVVKAYVSEEQESARFSRANDDLCDVNFRVLKLMAIISPVLLLIQNGAVIALIWIGGVNLGTVEATGMTTGTIMAGITYVTQVVHSIMMVTTMFQSVSRAMASATRVRELLDTDPAILGGTQEGSDAQAPVAIRMKDVSFRYPTAIGRPVLHDINLEIRRGETFAIIGATGAGKTSLVGLIPRFYDATDGSVEIDGVPIGEYRLDALRQKIGYVMQKSELFSDTVEGNIRWGDPNASHDEIRDAARAAQADGFITGFQDGYDTPIAEKGASLSGGQKQRISIARALTRNPEILILDDSTSALDLATEARLQRELRERLRDTTVVMIAQRIASVQSADRIAVLENGTITACAPHDELLKSSPTYREIYRSQMAATEKGGDAQ